ncbi:MAG: tRNA guanosine(34) transglycosylase Tgt [Bacillota bacterium]|nr:tRNA guanosine(34) transglycosylase Tgt [Candidatus Fermentithermobacillaceae bacterium]
MSQLKFDVTYSRGNSRIGELNTSRGGFKTPVFMPVGTQATVKSLLPEEVWDTGTRIILCNAYHLFLRPGPDVVRQAGGLHRFMNWPGSILTDSGGFQIMSLAHMVSISDEEATFRSHIDGSLVRFSPEEAVRIQVALGADLIMCLDHLTGWPVSLDVAREAMERTLLWARRSKQVPIQAHQSLFGIVQGSIYPELRRRCALELAAMDFPGYALGGLSVGESKEEFYDILHYTCEFLPADKPRYLMGVGHPVDLIEGVMAGIDMFDCVLPTRNARHGRAFTFAGPLNLKNARFAADFVPIEEGCDCKACAGFSRAHIRHLFSAKESLAWTLVSIHNIRFFQRLMDRIRQAVLQGTLGSLREEMEVLYPI